MKRENSIGLTHGKSKKKIWKNVLHKLKKNEKMEKKSDIHKGKKGIGKITYKWYKSFCM